MDRTIDSWPLPEGADFAAADRYAGDLNDADTLHGAVVGVESVFTLAGYEGLAGTLAHAATHGVARVVLRAGWTLLRPDSFMSNALRWLPQLRAGDEVREPFGDVPLSVVDPADIAAVALLALTTPDHSGQAYRLSGPEALTAAERLAILGTALGRELTLVVPDDEAAREGLSAGMPEPYVDAFFEFFRGGLIDETTVQSTVEDLLGRRVTLVIVDRRASAPTVGFLAVGFSPQYRPRWHGAPRFA
jgi:uncharacterized protein YbjT (DUF2867 family)